LGTAAFQIRIGLLTLALALSQPFRDDCSG
jgi:hypothetical protein